MKYRKIIAAAFAVIAHVQLVTPSQAQSSIEIIDKATGINSRLFLENLKNYKQKLLLSSTLDGRAPPLSAKSKKNCDTLVEFAIKQVSSSNSGFFPIILESSINITSGTNQYSKSFIEALAMAKAGGLAKKDWDNFIEYSAKKKTHNNTPATSRKRRRSKQINKKKHQQISYEELEVIYQNSFVNVNVNGHPVRATTTPTKFNVGKKHRLARVALAIPITVFTNSGIRETIAALTHGKHLKGTENHHLTQQRYDKFLALSANTHKYYNRLIHNTDKYKSGTKVNRSEFHKMISRLSKARGIGCTIQILEYMLQPSHEQMPAIVQLLYLTYGQSLIAQDEVEVEECEEQIIIHAKKRRIVKSPKNSFLKARHFKRTSETGGAHSYI